MFNITFICLFVCVGYANSDSGIKLKLREGRDSHEGLELSDEKLMKISKMSDMDHLEKVLDNILVPRVVGTASHTAVGDYIVSTMCEFGWHVEEDVFVDTTPTFGDLKFRNIIAKLNSEAQRFLILACHYDSKYTREGDFVGATDSAVPCAMMLNLAHVLSAQLAIAKASTELSLAFVFFDGEEAFRSWSATDSIYGARHLAARWAEAPYPPDAVSGAATDLDRIDVLMLLDLLGTPDPAFYSYDASAERWYVRLARAEQRLAAAHRLRNYSLGRRDQTYFRLKSSRAYIEDDHIPFQQRGVSILHVIPSPFPSVWHKPADNRAALDMRTVDNLMQIIRVFVVEYLHLSL